MSELYEVILENRAQRQLRKLPLSVVERLKPAILGLAEDPRPSGAKKLKGKRSRFEQWRVRVGDYRILYEIHDEVLVVLVITIAHRKDVYRDHN